MNDTRSTLIFFAKSLSRLQACVLALGVCAMLPLGAMAQSQGAASADALVASTQRWVDEALAKTGTELPLRMEVTVGEPDSRLRLAPCARTENYLPPGTRLWGRSRIGVRCVDGVARWNIFVPVTVKAFGEAWVVKAGVAPGAVLTPADAVLAEVDWAEDAGTVLADPALWVGQVATRTLTTGQVLRQNMIRAAQVFPVGAQVRVVAGGPGFQIASDGQALSGGVVGQLARVRMDNGRVLSGTVVDARTVRMAL